MHENGPRSGKAAARMGATRSGKAITGAAVPPPRASVSIPRAHRANAATANVVVALHVMAPTPRGRERSILHGDAREYGALRLEGRGKSCCRWPDFAATGGGIAVVIRGRYDQTCR